MKKEQKSYKLKFYRISEVIDPNLEAAGSLVGHRAPWLPQNCERWPGIYIRKWTWALSRNKAGDKQVLVPLPHTFFQKDITLDPLFREGREKGIQQTCSSFYHWPHWPLQFSEQKERTRTLLSDHPVLLQSDTN